MCQVEGLVKLSLNRPVRVLAAKPNTVAQRLIQEFVRIRASREMDRYILHLCTMLKLQ